MKTDDHFVNQGIIEPEQLAERLHKGQPNLVILDASFVLPGSAINPKQKYLKDHIEKAHFFDIEAVSDHNSALPHMLPTALEFEKAVSALNINNDSFIVVYGQSGIVMGPARAWWMFRYFGHDQVVILNGGLPAWKKAGYETISKETLSIKEPQSSFNAKIKPDLVKNKSQIEEAVTHGDYLIIDARSPARFSGSEAEPRAGLRSGNIDSSVNIPASSLICAEDGRLKNAEDLKNLFEDQGFALNGHKNVIATCGSGVTACMIALALYNLGSKNTAIYDGSWAEWGLIE